MFAIVRKLADEGEPCFLFVYTALFLFVGFALLGVLSCSIGEFDFLMAMFFPVFVLGPVQAVNATVGLSRKL